MSTIVISILLLGGSFFCLLSAVGFLRMRDTYARMHVATKSVAFGGAMLVLSHVVARPDAVTLLFGALIIGFFYMTLPLAGHVLGRTIYRRGILPAKPFVVNEAGSMLDPHQ
ncbi:MAG: cation:proton antiporter [Verrucomicrobiales bacterium]|nr:monovalent cation/H(+) antiporter subunit G [Verrucomicrobiota bacterium JB025]